MATEISSLQPEIMMKILSLVPAEDVFGLKGVCRGWRGLIASEEFKRLHLEQRRSSRKEEVIICVATKSKSIPIFAAALAEISCLSFGDFKNGAARVRCLSLGLEGCLRAVPNDLGIEELCDRHAQVLDSCDGLILLRVVPGRSSTRERMIICNPVTRRYRHFDFVRPSDSSLDKDDGSSVNWNIVYDSSVRRYKIIGLLISYQSEMKPMLTNWRCYVYELHHRVEQSSWKELKLPPLRKDVFAFFGAKLFVDGKLHFQLIMIGNGSEELKTSILSLDIAAGEFTHSPLKIPPENGHEGGYQFVSGGKLYQTYHSREKIELWMLEDFDRLVWSKHQDINLSSDQELLASYFGHPLLSLDPTCIIHPVTFLDEDCKLIMSIDKKEMVAYDESSGKWIKCASDFTKFAPTMDLLWGMNVHGQYAHHVNSLTSWICA